MVCHLSTNAAVDLASEKTYALGHTDGERSAIAEGFRRICSAAVRGALAVLPATCAEFGRTYAGLNLLCAKRVSRGDVGVSFFEERPQRPHFSQFLTQLLRRQLQ